MPDDMSMGSGNDTQHVISIIADLAEFEAQIKKVEKLLGDLGTKTPSPKQATFSSDAKVSKDVEKQVKSEERVRQQLQRTLRSQSGEHSRLASTIDVESSSLSHAIGILHKYSLQMDSSSAKTKRYIKDLETLILSLRHLDDIGRRELVDMTMAFHGSEVAKTNKEIETLTSRFLRVKELEMEISGVTRDLTRDVQEFVKQLQLIDPEGLGVTKNYLTSEQKRLENLKKEASLQSLLPGSNAHRTASAKALDIFADYKKSLIDMGQSQEAVQLIFDNFATSLKTMTVPEVNKTTEAYRVLNKEMQAMAKFRGADIGYEKKLNTLQNEYIRYALTLQKAGREEAALVMLGNLSSATNVVRAKGIKEVEIATTKLRQSTSKLTAEIKAAEIASPATPLQGFRQRLSKIAGWSSSVYILYTTIGLLKSSINTINEIEKAMIDMQKVMDSSKTNFDELRQSVFDLGRELGTVPKDVAEVMYIFARQGREQAEIVTLTRNALMAANITEMSTTSATKNLTASMNQLGYSASETIKLLDAWNEVSNKNAVGADDLADAFANTASLAKNLGMDIHELNALITVLAANTGKSGDEIGRTLRFSLQRAFGPEAQAALRTIAGVEIFKPATGELRAFGEIIEEVSQKWDTFSDAQKNAIAKAFGGSRRVNDMIILFENFNTLGAKVIEESMNSMGSAARENEKYMRSLSKRLDILVTNAKDIVVAFGDAGVLATFKTGVDILNSLLGFINSIPDPIKKTTMALLTAKMAGAAITKGLGLFNIKVGEGILSLAGFKAMLLSTATSAKTSIASVGALSLSFKGLGAAINTAMGPIGWAVLALGALSSAFQWYKNNKSFGLEWRIENQQDALKNMSKFKDAVEERYNSIAALRDEIYSIENSTLSDIEVQQKSQNVYERFNKILPGVASNYEDLRRKIEGVTDAAKADLDRVLQMDESTRLGFAKILEEKLTSLKKEYQKNQEYINEAGALFSEALGDMDKKLEGTYLSAIRKAGVGSWWDIFALRTSAAIVYTKEEEEMVAKRIDEMYMNLHQLATEKNSSIRQEISELEEYVKRLRSDSLGAFGDLTGVYDAEYYAERVGKYIESLYKFNADDFELVSQLREITEHFDTTVKDTKEIIDMWETYFDYSSYGLEQYLTALDRVTQAEDELMEQRYQVARTILDSLEQGSFKYYQTLGKIIDSEEYFNDKIEDNIKALNKAWDAGVVGSQDFYTQLAKLERTKVFDNLRIKIREMNEELAKGTSSAIEQAFSGLFKGEEDALDKLYDRIHDLYADTMAKGMAGIVEGSEYFQTQIARQQNAFAFLFGKFAEPAREIDDNLEVKQLMILEQSRQEQQDMADNTEVLVSTTSKIDKKIADMLDKPPYVLPRDDDGGGGPGGFDTSSIVQGLREIGDGILQERAEAAPASTLLTMLGDFLKRFTTSLDDASVATESLGDSFYVFEDALINTSYSLDKLSEKMLQLPSAEISVPGTAPKQEVNVEVELGPSIKTNRATQDGLIGVYGKQDAHIVPSSEPSASEKTSLLDVTTKTTSIDADSVVFIDKSGKVTSPVLNSPTAEDLLLSSQLYALPSPQTEDEKGFFTKVWNGISAKYEDLKLMTNIIATSAASLIAANVGGKKAARALTGASMVPQLTASGYIYMKDRIGKPDEEMLQDMIERFGWTWFEDDKEPKQPSLNTMSLREYEKIVGFRHSYDDLKKRKFTDDEIRMIATMVVAEAEGESEKGQKMVANVIFNRLRHKDYPDDVWGVLSQKNAFSPIADGRYQRMIDENKVTEKHIQLVKEALERDLTGGALFFQNPEIATSTWQDRNTRVHAVEGNHEFRGLGFTFLNQNTEYIEHVVELGENLSVLAEKYGTTIADIMVLNRLFDTNIKRGQKLIVAMDAEIAKYLDIPRHTGDVPLRLNPLGLAGGGFTGIGGKLEPAGIVHKGEWVAPAWMVREYGSEIARLEEIRKRGYAQGGMVSAFTPGTSGAVGEYDVIDVLRKIEENTKSTKDNTAPLSKFELPNAYTKSVETKITKEVNEYLKGIDESLSTIKQNTTALDALETYQDKMAESFASVFDRRFQEFQFGVLETVDQSKFYSPIMSELTRVLGSLNDKLGDAYGVASGKTAVDAVGDFAGELLKDMGMPDPMATPIKGFFQDITKSAFLNSELLNLIVQAVSVFGIVKTAQREFKGFDLKKLFGFKAGGYTSGGNVNQVAGVVHGGEWVAPAWMVRKYGDLFTQLEKARVKGYRSGGFTSDKVSIAQGTLSDSITLELEHGELASILKDIRDAVVENEPEEDTSAVVDALEQQEKAFRLSAPPLQAYTEQEARVIAEVIRQIQGVGFDPVSIRTELDPAYMVMSEKSREFRSLWSEYGEKMQQKRDGFDVSDLDIISITKGLQEISPFAMFDPKTHLPIVTPAVDAVLGKEPTMEQWGLIQEAIYSLQLTGEDLSQVLTHYSDEIVRWVEEFKPQDAALVEALTSYRPDIRNLKDALMDQTKLQDAIAGGTLMMAQTGSETATLMGAIAGAMSGTEWERQWAKRFEDAGLKNLPSDLLQGFGQVAGGLKQMQDDRAKGGLNILTGLSTITGVGASWMPIVSTFATMFFGGRRKEEKPKEAEKIGNVRRFIDADDGFHPSERFYLSGRAASLMQQEMVVNNNFTVKGDVVIPAGMDPEDAGRKFVKGAKDEMNDLLTISKRYEVNSARGYNI